MPLSVNNSISALNALSTKQNVTANNIANSETKGFKKSTAVLEESSTGAVNSRIQTVNTPGTIIPQADGTLEEMSNVDLIQETTAMITTRHAYEANLKALKISTAMEDNALDMIG
ncbi:flagellar basal body rod C-terminal domain-containing protein [uncultured Desulfuromusa sp.]|uniref:flagellar basal body rod C-terminal domain-containing protein n=1 Tax=uncultured Desulfuromusa sp. TaxID=219183 RepID=UPI002AA84641|nr:flagellar basal body rod C-terminal domain-containing protein [uncultured Desulfuromusa sp.]